MISIIICSRTKLLNKDLELNVKNTIGVEYEIINIDNSNNSHSIFSAYNLGFQQSKYPYLCFLHEDVKFHTDNWGKLLINHLNKRDAGIVGLAGGNIVTRIPASWSASSKNINIIQSDNSGKKQTERLLYPPDNTDIRRSAILLDGVLLSMNRALMNKCKFDETLKGFHGYDFDITLQSAISGYKNYVVYDILLEHFSRGRVTADYYRNLITIFKKWEKYLPLIGENTPENERKEISKIERKRLNRLTRVLTRSGFKTKDIVSETRYFAKIINSKTNTFSFFIWLRISLTRILELPNYFLRS